MTMKSVSESRIVDVVRVDAFEGEELVLLLRGLLRIQVHRCSLQYEVSDTVRCGYQEAICGCCASVTALCPHALRDGNHESSRNRPVQAVKNVAEKGTAETYVDRQAFCSRGNRRRNYQRLRNIQMTVQVHVLIPGEDIVGARFLVVRVEPGYSDVIDVEAGRKVYRGIVGSGPKTRN